MANNVVSIPASDTMTVEQALHSALEYMRREDCSLQDVLIIATDEAGSLFIRSSRMSRKDALWLTEYARKHALGELDP